MSRKVEFAVRDLVRVIRPTGGYITAYVTQVHTDHTITVANAHGFTARVPPSDLRHRPATGCPACSPPDEMMPENHPDEGKPVTLLVKVLAWVWWNISNQLDRVPGFDDAMADLYNRNLAQELIKGREEQDNV